MSRGVGVAEWFADAPEVVRLLAALATQLGDLWFLALSLVTLYWLGPHTPILGEAVDRDRMAVVLGLLFLTVAFTVVLKEALALPRPPWFAEPVPLEGVLRPLNPLYGYFADASGYGFPSGHAIGTTVGWGGMAWAVRAGRPRTRIAVAASVVAIVSLTRLILGVHFLVDVVVGAIVGLALLAVAVSWRSPAVPFAFAPIVGALGVAQAGLTTDAAGALGIGIGGAVGWAIAGRGPASAADARTTYWAMAIGVLLMVPPLALAALGPVPPAVTLLTTALGGVGIVALPLLAREAEKRIGE